MEDKIRELEAKVAELTKANEALLKKVDEQACVTREIMSAEKRCRTIIGSLSDYIFTVRIINGLPSETMHSESCRVITGYAAEEFYADPYLWITMVHEDDRDAVRKQASSILTGNTPAPLEHRIIRKDGVIRWVRSALIPHLSESGALAYYDGIIVDITERKEAEEDLRQTYNKLKQVQGRLIHLEKIEAVSRLSGGMAHEMKNPLAVALQGIEYLERRVGKGDSSAPEVFEHIKSALKKIDDIINTLAMFVNSAEASPVSIDVNMVIEDALALSQHRCSTEGIRIIRELKDGLPHVKVDVRAMTTAFFNIIQNAVQSMPRGGKLRTRSYYRGLPQNDGGNVIIEIEDTGIGIAQEDINKIFEPFYKTKVSSFGSGMGLFVASNIIEMHGGAIQVTSRKDEGTKFIVSLRAERGEMG